MSEEVGMDLSSMEGWSALSLIEHKLGGRVGVFQGKKSFFFDRLGANSITRKERSFCCCSRLYTPRAALSEHSPSSFIARDTPKHSLAFHPSTIFVCRQSLQAGCSMHWWGTLVSAILFTISDSLEFESDHWSFSFMLYSIHTFVWGIPRRRFSRTNHLFVWGIPPRWFLQNEIKQHSRFLSLNMSNWADSQSLSDTSVLAILTQSIKIIYRSFTSTSHLSKLEWHLPTMLKRVCLSARDGEKKRRTKKEDKQLLGGPVGIKTENVHRTKG